MKNLNIVILTYNEIDTIKKCLKALYTYTKNFNLVVIENNSTDGTSQFLSEMDKEGKRYFILIHQAENIGVIAGRNAGYFIAKNIYPDAEYTCFLDSDQFVLEGWQDIYSEWIEKGYDIIGCEAWSLRKTDFYPVKKVSCSIDSFSYIGAGGLMLKNSVIEDIGLFDKRFHPMYWEDPDLCFRAFQAGYKIGWDYKGSIEHQPHKLLTPERKVYFNNSWKKFQEKWKGFEIPVFKMD